MSNEIQNAILNNELTNIIVIGLGTTGAEYVDNIVSTLKLYGQGQLKKNQAFYGDGIKCRYDA
jgi:hypothetical protein